jgi:hypothetical protein
MAPADFTAQTNAIIDRLAAAIADSSQACAAPWCTGVLDGSWLHTGWRTFAQWKPSQLVFTTAPQTIALGAPSQPLTVELRTNTGLAYTAGVPLALTLTTTSPAGGFAASPAGPWTPSFTATIPSGARDTSVYYQDAQPGTALVSAAAPGKVVATQAEMIGAPTDTVPPETSIASAPARLLRSRTATFTLASEPGTHFECSLDGAPFTACSAQVAYVNLAQGRHTLAVRAVDAAGNADATPVRTTWTVDTVAPNTRIVGNSRKGAKFWFTAAERGARYECSLDGRGFTPCKSPQGYTLLTLGRHTFRVRAIDAAGNVEASPASFAWRP